MTLLEPENGKAEAPITVKQTPLEDHEENLAWIDLEIDDFSEAVSHSGQLLLNSLTTLRKVLERHAPVEREATPTPSDPNWYNVECASCHMIGGGFALFPCDEYATITEGLRIAP
ncbi:hypothetical protein UFOVP1608_48 [uncultured Caudovirales phage]|uniref:Uncharacterized protein n=1 Tax=uncultured Caudovirales phage TaxID=2100421 RepID=A0A6J5SU04_9CAUD|nr:hypothetical protein UFOVP1608_48 [uncultured Caudovirales phage]